MAADAVASSILGMVSDKLGSMVLEELRSMRDVGEELEKLESNLSSIRSALAEAEGRQVKGQDLKDWLKKLKGAAYDIDDVLDEAAAAALKHSSPGDHQFRCTDMVRKFLSLPRSLKFRHGIAGKMKEIRKRLETISNEKSSFHLGEGPAAHYSEYSEANSGGRETYSHVDSSQVFGRDEDKKQIIHFLLHGCNEQNLEVISIIGLGGLGKTTLAQLVYNDEHVREHFDAKMWAYVSEKFVIKNIIALIIESLTEKKPHDSSSMDSIVKELLMLIRGKRFLLVLDDVWNEDDYESWDKLERLLKDGAKGSKVIVTTRSRRVASVMKSAEELRLNVLPEDECWKLFESRAFESSADARSNNSNLVAIGREIVQKCGGLPLAAKALGSVMRFKKEESEWRAIRDNEIWTSLKDDKDILPALMLSYYHLSPGHVKQCFAYCSIFPKGTEICVVKLVQLWVAEGFAVDTSNGFQYVDQLISRSLLEKIMDGDDGEYMVKMHDMVHNLAKFVAGDECSIVYAPGGSSTSSVSQNSRYISIVLDEAIPSPPALIPSRSRGYKLRTFHLIYRKNYSEGEEDICQKVLGSIVSSMKLLRVLHLSGLAIKELPARMDKLVHLRYLNLSSSNLKSLPPTIGKLVHLQHLDLSLTCLKSLPPIIGKLVHLDTLDLSRTGLQALPPTIGTLPNLQRLYLSYCKKLEEIPDSIGGLTNLLTLSINGCNNLHFLPDTIGKLVHLDTLDLSYTGIQALPPTIETLRSLQKLNLSYCNKLEEIPNSIGSLSENLSILNLSGCKSLHSLPDSIGCICNLQVLDISNLVLEALPESLSSLSNLRRLDLSNCYRLRELPKNIQSMRSLTDLMIDGCDSLTSMPKGIGQMSQLQELSVFVLGDGEKDARLTELGTLMNLNGGDLHIKNLQNVKDVAEATGANLRERQSISSLVLEWDFDASWWERKYESIDDFESKMKAVIERVAAMDAGHVRLLEDVLSSLQPNQNLRRLQIKSYVGKVLPGWMMDLSNLVVLRLESFARCDDLKALEKLSCLEDLTLDGFPSLECLPRFGQLPRLRNLRLWLLPGVKRLGAELYGGAGAFPALRWLGLSGMLGLEEWSEPENGNYEEGGNDFLSRLPSLVLIDCPKLQALPSNFPSVSSLHMNADDKLMVSCLERGAFPNLKELNVWNCMDSEDESCMPEVLVQLLHSVEHTWKLGRLNNWNHSMLEIHKMRVDTLKEIAREIDNKMAMIGPSSSS